MLDPNNIVDIVDASKVPDSGAFAPQEPAPSAQRSEPLPAAASFADPAILSYKPRSSQPTAGPRLGSDNPALPNTSEKRDPGPVPIPSVRVETLSRQTTPTGTVTELEAEPVNVIEHQGPLASGIPAQGSAPPQTQDQGQRRKRRQRQSKQPRNGAPDEHVDASPVDQSKGAGRGKGWRQTPILQSTSSFQPFNSLKRGSRGRTPINQENGWASEDVTDVQEAGDFDFEGSLAKFDKRTLFDQMRKDDQVDDADRLVSHNRQQQQQQKAKPGTAGGKNLHYSENVLDTASGGPAKSQKDAQPVVGQDFWNSEADDGIINGGERLSGREHGSRQSSRRGESKMSTTRRSQSRKASANTTNQGPMRVNSGVSVQSQGLRGRGRVASSRIDELSVKQLSTAKQGFYLLPSNRHLEVVSALQMLNLENIAHNELGLTEDMMTENAGRGIAEVALRALADPAIRMRARIAESSVSGAAGPSSSPPPTVVILAGNNKSGIRAVAAGRHLRNKGMTILLCVVGIERGERELLEDMRQQVRLYKNFGGRVYTKGELFEHLRKVSIPTLTIDTPRNAITAKPSVVTLIIDALLGLAISFEELRTGDQATCYELIEWANRNEAFVLAVDLPTGIDPSSGRASIVDGNRLYVRPRYVVEMGAPKRGLLEAMAAAAEAEHNAPAAEATAADDSVLDWNLFLVDIGLGAAVWKKAGTKIRRGIDFDDKWVLEMRYQGAPGGQDEYA